jgi:hypothetical protein
MTTFAPAPDAVAAASSAAAAQDKPDLVARLEPRLGIVAMAVGAVMLVAVPLPALTVGIGTIFNAAGIQLLGQGLCRDLWILGTRRAAPACGDACAVGKSLSLWRRLLGRAAMPAAAPVKSAPILCLESALGAGLIGIGLLLMASGATAALTLPQGVALAVAGGWWMLGWALRDVVFELKRAPDHINVAVGFGGPDQGA